MTSSRRRQSGGLSKPAGRNIARKAKAFDMRVLGVKRIAVPKPEFVDELWTPEHLGDLLAQSDFFVITLSSTPRGIWPIGPRGTQADEEDGLSDQPHGRKGH